MGQPPAFALSSCVLAVRLGEQLGLPDDDLRSVYYQSLLRYVGCNADTRLLAAIFGDELALRTDIIHLDNTQPDFLGLLTRFIRQANAGAPPLAMLQAIAAGLATSARFTHEFFSGHCEVAGRLAQRLGLEENLVRAMSQVYARWDGKGIPPLKGEAIAPGMLIVSLAQDAVYYYRLAGLDGAVAMARKRKGTMYAPAHVETFCRTAAQLLAGIDDEPSWPAVLELEPGRRRYLSEAEFDRACQAMADFADLKSPFMLGHSPGVAELAAQAAVRCGLPQADVQAVRRAGMLHDLGRVGITAGIWVKLGPLSEHEWEQVRLHPYYTERVLSRPESLARLGALASLHHERLDGSGYHRGSPASQLPPLARILATADVYHALTEPRPHRPAQPAEAAADLLKREVRAGRLDREAVDGVLEAAGHGARPARKQYVAGLSEREIDVLRLVARGQSIKQIAKTLVVSPKTVDNHIQHIYTKTGVTTRAGATLFAVENNLLD
jgi:HD-GYP domain-containing protein (c-di-GMP phosphodiesterase class II)